VPPTISAVVCTFNRKDMLVDAIDSLIRQDLPPPEFDVIVVDNNSTDGTAATIESRYGHVPNLRLVHEPVQGLAAARNAGVSAATSPFVAFTDDDAVVPPDWLRRLAARFEELDPMTAIIGGGIDPIFESERPAWLIDELMLPLSAGLPWKNGPRYLDSDEWVCEVNSAYRVAPLMEHGGFPVSLGRIGENLMSGENVVNKVLRHQGHLVYYDPHIVVQHRVPSSRLTRRWFRRRIFWEGASRVLVRKYLLQRGIEVEPPRSLCLPCTPADWLRLVDDDLEGEDLSESFYRVEDIGFLLASQSLLGVR
jgi:glycosyltransferase involved in cell wall biosynthesis